MLPERLSAYLRYFVSLVAQPANRWDGFDLRASEARSTSLRSQLFFVGCALATLANHSQADPDESALATSVLADLTDRMIQRRVWAAWAAETERASRKPDPIDAGYGAYSGALCMLFGLQAALGRQPRYRDDPFMLRWSADVRSIYTTDTLAEALWRQMRASPDGAIFCEGDLATSSAMATVLWALRLHDLAYGSDYGAAGAAWLTTLRERMAIRGPRLLNPRTLAGSFNLRSRRAASAGDSLEDAWTLALMAPLDCELVAGLAERYWLSLPKKRERSDTLVMAFSYLLAVELGDTVRAEQLLSYADEWLGPENDPENGRRYTGASTVPWATALYAIGESGGLGRLLDLTPRLLDLTLPPVHAYSVEPPAEDGEA
ncbi:MAG: hypothetical protein HGA19_08770 [Oscillochloris sp.]|nr:hypothetical protein [Oscillochloris sp.]